jgi:misacylated tRNA(Ala) deacylase
MTGIEQLYVEDSYIKEFDATVIRSGPRYIILNRTAFYPEAGGQPCDIGVITYQNEKFRVIKVMQRRDQIYHYLDGDIPETVKVHGRIDWDRRYTHMRLHSGEHLLTGLFEEIGSGPKVFSSFTQLDFKPSSLEEETLKKVEKKFNKVVEKDVPVEIYYQDREKLEVGDDRRKQEFLEKIQNADRLRMVKIGSYAMTFCMGTHVKSTGEIGKLEELRLESKKKRRKIVYFKLKDISFY